MGQSWQDYPDVYVDVAAGGSHSCAVGQDMRVVCWGVSDGGVSDVGKSQNNPVIRIL